MLLKLQHLSSPKWAQGHAVSQTKTDRQVTPVDDQLDSEVIAFRAQFDQKSPLDELVREGARRMLQSGVAGRGSTSCKSIFAEARR